MTFQQELNSWNPFARSHKLSPVPEVGKEAPVVTSLHIPKDGDKPTIIQFLRHCGCPFAEKAFRSLRAAADQYTDVYFVAVSHSDQKATSNWLDAVGGAGKVEIIVDEERSVYGAYGLGLSTFWHNLNPWSLSSVFNLQRSEKIEVRPTESGSRWQTAGLFAANGNGIVEYAHVAQAADDLGDLQHALKSVGR